MTQRFRSALQPIIDGVTGRVIAHEALMREASIQSPLSLIANAECSGEGSPLESQVRQAALGRLPDLPTDQKLFVNIDTRDITVPITSTQPHRIVLELTERHPIVNNRPLLQQILKWRQSGYAIALDNYGCGHMGLSALVTVKPDAIKIGRPLIQNLNTDPVRLAAVDGVVTLAHRLNITVIALGVETQDEFWAARDMGIRWMQGFLLAYPGPEPITAVSIPLRRKAGPLIPPPC